MSLEQKEHSIEIRIEDTDTLAARKKVAKHNNEQETQQPPAPASAASGGPAPTVGLAGRAEDSDATVVFHRGSLAGGSKFTADYARRVGKPVLTVDVKRASEETLAEVVRMFVDEHEVEVLNVAGPRASKCPVVAAVARAILVRALADGGP